MDPPTGSIRLVRAGRRRIFSEPVGRWQFFRKHYLGTPFRMCAKPSAEWRERSGPGWDPRAPGWLRGGIP